MKNKIVFILLVVFILFPVISLNAVPQSFYVPSGQVIKDGSTVQMYCLERSKDVLKVDNLAELTNIIGNVSVLYSNGTVSVSSFSELYKSGKIGILPLGSYEYMEIYFNDESIKQITVGNEGIGLFRDKMTDYETTLSTRNIERILELERQGLHYTRVQNIIWRTRVPRIVYDQDKKIQIIDFQTTDVEEKKVYGTYPIFPPRKLTYTEKSH